jgi:uncharacterized protein YdaU (DUF1376 family)
MSSPLPYFQFYVKDWLSSSAVRMMSLAAKGLYIDLLALQWNEGDLPADLTKLAKLAKVNLKVFRRLWPEIETCFPSQDGLTRSNLRMKEDRQNALMKSKCASSSAAKRWSNSGSKEPPKEACERIYERNTNVVRTQCYSDTESDTDTDIKEREEISLRDKKKERNPDLLRDQWEQFCSVYPKRSGGDRLTEAKSKFEKLCLNCVGFERVLAGATRYRIHCDRAAKTGTQYVQQKATWLNQAGYDVEYAEPRREPSVAEKYARIAAEMEFEAMQEQAVTVDCKELPTR